MSEAFADIQARFADALVDAALPPPAGVTCARGGADAARFAVYRNNVHVGLTRALESRFPVTRRLVGDEFFRGMARAYVQRHKPATPLLFRYGGDFAAFVGAFPPAAGLPYLADVARLEDAWSRAYHAADATSLAAAALASLPPDRLARARLEPHPAAALIASRHPVGAIWSAHQGAEVAPVARWVAETVLVTRPAMAVGVHRLPADDAAFAEALFRGATLSAAAAAAGPGFDFGRAVVGLVGLGAFASVEVRDGEEG